MSQRHPFLRTAAIALVLCLPSLSAPPARAYSGEEEKLLELLRARDTSLRVAAAMGLREYAPRSGTARTRLLDILRDQGEPRALRRQCAKSLALVHDQSEVYLPLLALAESSEDDDLRAAALKSLYNMTDESEVRRRILDVLNRGAWRESLDVRRAAAWALFMVSGTPEAERALRDLAKSSEDELLRAEAVKSLFGAARYPDVQRDLFALAEDPLAPLGVRYAAILCFIPRRGDAAVRRRLEALQDSQEPQIATAATWALTRPMDEAMLDFFHLNVRPNGTLRDPLVNE